MTAQPRPNLGGLFNGSTPADRTSSIAGRLGPRLLVAPPDDAALGEEPSAKADPGSAGQRSIRPAQETASTAVPGGESDDRSGLAWLDPIRALRLYFGLLQAVLDVNRDVTLAVAEAIIKVPRRLR